MVSFYTKRFPNPYGIDQYNFIKTYSCLNSFMLTTVWIILCFIFTFKRILNMYRTGRLQWVNKYLRKIIKLFESPESKKVAFEKSMFRCWIFYLYADRAKIIKLLDLFSLNSLQALGRKIMTRLDFESFREMESRLSLQSLQNCSLSFWPKIAYMVLISFGLLL